MGIQAPVKTTPGQELRGHGENGWKDAGWDYTQPTQLSPQLRELILHYGQLAQATYDNLGLNPCDAATWGYTTTPPGTSLIDYLTADYPLDPDAKVAAGSRSPGTRDVYHVPKSERLSAVIYAQAGGDNPDAAIAAVDAGAGSAEVAAALAAAQQAGGGAAASAAATRTPGWGHWGILDGAVDGVFGFLAGIPTAIIGGARPLFKQNPATGRGTVPRPAFMGYVAMSPAAGGAANGEVDVAFVWRGTIFKEEWAANFGSDQLVRWRDMSKDGHALPWQVGVHRGFQDLYMRPAPQPDPKTLTGAPPAGAKPTAPRDVVHNWIAELCRRHNVTTITTTGHSLGGALSTVSAFDIGEEVDRLWAPGNEAERAGWRTAAKPTVTAFAFAPPRVGNWNFVRTFRDKHNVNQLRICNIHDAVPKVPGGWVQLLTSFLYELGIDVYSDMDSPAARAFAGFYTAVSAATALFWRSRWGYFHAGTIMEVDSDSDPAFNEVGSTPRSGRFVKLPSGKHHNLEVYLYLLSLKGAAGGTTTRNKLFLNKGDDILEDKTFPADWWRAPLDRRYRLRPQDGRWEHY
ncbi:hypothetical protein HYH02_010631 [Chlamydomonas schloesseri]|uniref:Phospholipase A1 n=1 Tax=Chlamydomonas schloesseri TaxID=2026947 RepID=A0A835W785_9CHLO|nr:hypothetical protein HYH02_010631 [Chlamydomonas schloesseri]|eukprot:KAG2439754.1 hypothetical protein HYH02_010631 [Chlamydomonas schloesseri]